MFKIYYLICVDFIVKSKSVNSSGWKFATLMYMSAFFSIFIISISSILESLFNFTIGSSKGLLEIKLEAIYLYFVPSLIINYFLIFYNKNYEKLLEKYKPNDGKYILRVILSSLGIFIISIIIIMLMCKYNG